METILHRNLEFRRAKPLLLSATVMAFCAALSACGGGGSGGGGFLPVATDTPVAPKDPPPVEPVAPTTPTTPVAPVTPPPTTPVPPTVPPKDPYAPVEGSEPAPELRAPQPGSTAMVGSDFEGIYESTFGYTFIGATGQLARKDILDWTWGSIEVTGLTWAFKSPTLSLSDKSEIKTVIGAGTFSPKKSMDGSFTVDGGASRPWGPLKYSAANALAVGQDNLKGKWSTESLTGIGMSIEIDAHGFFTGTTSGTSVGVCNLTGAIAQQEPGTAKNMFYLRIEAINGASGTQKACVLDTELPYYGPAGIVLSAAGSFPQNGYWRNVAWHAITLNGKLLTLILRKQ